MGIVYNIKHIEYLPSVAGAYKRLIRGKWTSLPINALLSVMSPVSSFMWGFRFASAAGTLA